MAIWTPDLTGRTGPKYRMLADAIAQAVAKGELRPGSCLPPHRILAYEIGMSPNTTSRAYAECVKPDCFAQRPGVAHLSGLIPGEKAMARLPIYTGRLPAP